MKWNLNTQRLGQRLLPPDCAMEEYYSISSGNLFYPTCLWLYLNPSQRLFPIWCGKHMVNPFDPDYPLVQFVHLINYHSRKAHL